MQISAVLIVILGYQTDLVPVHCTCVLASIIIMESKCPRGVQDVSHETKVCLNLAHRVRWAYSFLPFERPEDD